MVLYLRAELCTEHILCTVFVKRSPHNIWFLINSSRESGSIFTPIAELSLFVLMGLALITDKFNTIT